MKTVYVVTMTMEAVVVAETKREAIRVFEKNLKDMDGEREEANITAEVATEEDKASNASIIPWGSTAGNLTVSELDRSEKIE